MKIKPYSKLYSDKTGISTDVFTRDQLLEVIEQCAKACEGRIGGAVPDNKWYEGFRSAMKQCAESVRKLKGELL